MVISCCVLITILSRVVPNFCSRAASFGTSRELASDLCIDYIHPLPRNINYQLTPHRYLDLPLPLRVFATLSRHSRIHPPSSLSPLPAHIQSATLHIDSHSSGDSHPLQCLAQRARTGKSTRKSLRMMRSPRRRLLHLQMSMLTNSCGVWSVDSGC